MRLKNRKTGEIVDTKDYNFKIATPAEPLYGHDAFDVREEYNSLAELNEEWEDYKEPLIKDEKVRKVIRAWAEANGVSELFSYEAVSGCPFWYIMAYRDEGGLTLDLWGEFPKELTNDKNYTITELCGEEEE